MPPIDEGRDTIVLRRSSIIKELGYFSQAIPVPSLTGIDGKVAMFLQRGQL
jgi:hypothetical protein